MVTNADYMEEMVSSPDYSQQQASADPGVNPAPVKVTWSSIQKPGPFELAWQFEMSKKNMQNYFPKRGDWLGKLLNFPSYRMSLGRR